MLVPATAAIVTMLVTGLLLVADSPTLWAAVLAGAVVFLAALWFSKTTVYSRMAHTSLGCAIGVCAIPTIQAWTKLEVFSLAKLIVAIRIDGVDWRIVGLLLAFAAFCLWHHRLEVARIDQAIERARQKGRDDPSRIERERSRLRNPDQWQGRE